MSFDQREGGNATSAEKNWFVALLAYNIRKNNLMFFDYKSNFALPIDNPIL